MVDMINVVKKLFESRTSRIGIFLIIAVIFYLNLPKTDCRDCNLILISVDTLRPDHMGVYGYKKDTTPNIDNWAKNAFVFTNIRTLVPVTYPSFSILMTGLGPINSGIFSNSVNFDGIDPQIPEISDNARTLAEILKQNNYKTAAFVTNPALDPELTKLGKGFDTYDQIDYGEDRQSYERFIKNSVGWLDKNKNKKFFLWVHLMDPHIPYRPADDFVCKFNQKYCPEISKKGLSNAESEREKLEGCRKEKLPDDRVKFFRMLYDGAVASADRLVGEILNKIKDTKLDKDTIVIFYGDHGEGFDHKYYFRHGEVLYDSSLKIPFIMKVPFIDSKNKKINTILDNSQIFKTVLSLLSISYQTNQSIGKNFGRILSNSNKPTIDNNSKQYIFSVNSNFDKFSIQDNQFKLIYSLPGGICTLNAESQELYDLVNDPQEITNLAESKPDVAEKLTNELSKYIARFKIETSKNANKESKEKLSTKKRSLLEKLKSLGY